MARNKAKIPKLIFSGIQPTGSLHLGNYLGAIKPWVRLQDEYPETRRLFSIVDMHALTNRYNNLSCDPDKYDDVGNDSIEMTLALLACGIDPNKSTIFIQSQVPQHAELTWLLSCIAPHRWLNTMLQYKEKKSNGSSLGLYSYPVLMSADVLLYKADCVPVGEDQSQHLELAKNYAKRFNSLFGECMVLPQAKISNFARVMSLKNASNKMSKSDKNDMSRINLTDSPDLMEKKIMKAKTDSIQKFYVDPKHRKELTNLSRIYCELEDVSIKEVNEKFGEHSLKYFKEHLAESVVRNICPIGDQIIEMRESLDIVDAVLRKGQNEAFDIAERNLLEYKDAMNLLI